MQKKRASGRTLFYIQVKIRGLLCGGCGLSADDTVLSESTCQCEFTEFVSDHVFSHKDIDESLAVVDIESMSDEIRNNHGTAGPSFDWSLHSGLIHFFHLDEEISVNERSFFYRSCHYFFLRATINLLEVFFLLRVLLPFASLPHGETGCPPPLERPSPPPIGWSTGFMATPRTCGRNPR